jgi:tetratricopeptide (TPR) repeat protein
MTTRAAVVIGINYDRFPEGISAEAQERGGFGKLQFAETDARDMAAVLTAAGYDIVSLLGVDATREAIIEAILKQRQTAGPDGLLVIYFAGHGHANDDEIAYLIPVDIKAESIEATGITLTSLVSDYLNKTRTSVALFDCCHSGHAMGVRGADNPETRGRAFLVRATRAFDMSGRAVLAACPGARNAYELPDLRHGAFTYYLLDCWRNTAGEVDLDAVYQSIRQGLHERNLPQPARGGSYEGSVVLREALPVSTSIQAATPIQPQTEAMMSPTPEEAAQAEARRKREYRTALAISVREPEFQAAVTQRNIATIIKVGDIILDIDQYHQPTRDETIAAHIRRAIQHLTSANFPTALADCERVLFLDPDHLDAHLYRGRANLIANRATLALPDFEYLRHRDPQNAEYWYWLGMTYMHLTEYADAVIALDEAIELNPKEAEYYYQLGNAYRAANNVQEARTYFALAEAHGHPNAAEAKQRLPLKS